MQERIITSTDEDKRFLEAAEQFYTDARELYEKDVEDRKRKNEALMQRAGTKLERRDNNVTEKIHYFILRG